MKIDIHEGNEELLVSLVGTHRKTAFCLTVHADVAVVIDTTENRPLTSVTNAADFTIEGIKQYLKYLPKQVIYLDTIGSWSRLKHDGEKFSGFAPLKIGVNGNDLTIEEAVDLVTEKTLH